MNIITEVLKKSQLKIIVELSPEETLKYLEKAAKQVAEMVKVPGFRPGQAPLEVLKKHVREGAIEAHMFDIALPETYSETIKKEKIDAISRPKITILQDSPFKYEAIVAMYPEVKISGYDKLKIKKEETPVEEKDVDAVIFDIQQRRATYTKTDRAAQKGDRVEIDFEGFDDGGAPLENTTSKHHPVIIGAGTLVAEFEENLIGTKKDDKKEFDVKFPKDYFHKPFQNKKVSFKIFIHEVEEVQLPELTPEFIKEISGEAKTQDELKNQIRENLKQEKQNTDKTRRENELLDKIVDLTKVDIPELLVEEEIDAMIEEMQNELSQQGISLEQFLTGAKKTVEDLREERKKQAEKRLQLRFGLQQIFKQENFEANEDELKKEVDHIITLYPENEREKIMTEYKEGSYLRRRLENKIRMDKLFAAYLAQ